MSLPVTNLDDRRFQQLVDEAKRKIPQLCPEWTNHNVSDPGVALIELFAWMTEISLFRLNQVPDNFYTHMLNLIGCDIFPAKAATADITFWVSGTPQEVFVPAGTQLSSASTVGDAVVFTTLADAVITQPKPFTALTTVGDDRYEDVWDELTKGPTLVECFPRSPLTPGDAFYIGFEESLAGRVIRLDVAATAEGIGVVPDRAPIDWQVYEGTGWIEAEIPTLVGEATPADTTGGLNRDGSVTLIIPPVHEPTDVNGTRAFWLRARLRGATRVTPTYQRSPQLRTLAVSTIGGTAPAEHSQIITDEILGMSDGKPGQVFRCGSQPVLERHDGETLVVVTDQGEEEWREIDDFFESVGTDRVFVWDSTTGEVTFGPLVRYPDGSAVQRGAIPPDGALLRINRYRSGGGRNGNVGAGALSNLQQNVPYVSGAENLRPATGGVDAEAVENAKIRGPQSLRSGGRAVTISDFERLANEANSGISRVRCLPPMAEGDPTRLLVVPKIEDEPEMLALDELALPENMITSISEYLDDRRVLGSKIEVRTPYYQGVSVAALVFAKPSAPADRVRERAKSALYHYINPHSGGADGRGWPFDGHLSSAMVFQVLNAVEGVERTEEVLFFEYDLRNGRRLGSGKELIRLEPQSLFLSAAHQVVVR
jgi:predicted phage baseplate assembly protein